MNLLLDEDSQGRIFARLLRAAGHDVVTVSEAGLAGNPDALVFAHAKQTNRVLLTRNITDFLELHDADTTHSGILAEYQDDELSKNMTMGQIVTAIGKIEVSGWSLDGQFVSINAWR